MSVILAALTETVVTCAFDIDESMEAHSTNAYRTARQTNGQRQIAAAMLDEGKRQKVRDMTRSAVCCTPWNPWMLHTNLHHVYFLLKLDLQIATSHNTPWLSTSRPLTPWLFHVRSTQDLTSGKADLRHSYRRSNHLSLGTS